MFTLFRTYFLFLFLFFFLYACSQTNSCFDFEFTAHHLKLQFDPDSQYLIAVDTISVKYSKNVDTIYFFLHDSLQVKRVNVAHQELFVQQIEPNEFKNISSRLPITDPLWTDHTQILKVHIPKSLYPEHIQVRYEGFISAALDSVLWCPALPDAMSSYFLTAVVPKEYRLTSNGLLQTEQINDYWRLCQWVRAEPGVPITLEIIKSDS